ncbi:hypothetical protein [Cohnella cellulosilytica]|uniref:hypothetical protein n=1 Tax=Cohnella cellulosilytica TaxID=986710 RepID=UPI00360A7D38
MEKAYKRHTSEMTPALSTWFCEEYSAPRSCLEKGEKLPVSADEARVLIGAKLALPE